MMLRTRHSSRMINTLLSSRRTCATGIWPSSGEWGFWTLPGWNGKFEPELSSLSNRINVLYLWYGVVLRLKVHPREQMAQKKRSSRKSLSLIFTFTKKLLIRHLRGTFEHSLVLGGGNLNEIISKSSNVRGDLGTDRRIIFIASVNRCVVDSKAYSVAFKSLISIISRT